MLCAMHITPTTTDGEPCYPRNIEVESQNCTRSYLLFGLLAAFNTNLYLSKQPTRKVVFSQVHPVYVCYSLLCSAHQVAPPCVIHNT